MESKFAAFVRLFSDSCKQSPPATASFGGSFRAACRQRWASWVSTQALKERGGRQRHQPEHQVAHHFGRSPARVPNVRHHVFQQTVHPLAGTAFLEPLRLGRREPEFFSATRVVGIARQPSRRLRLCSQGTISPTCAWRTMLSFALVTIAGHRSLRIRFRAERPSHAPARVGSFRNRNSTCN